MTNENAKEMKDYSLFTDFLDKLIRVGKYIPADAYNYAPLDNEVLIHAPSLTVPLLVKERNVYFDETYSSKTQWRSAKLTEGTYFASSVGRFLIELGLDVVQEHYCKDATEKEISSREPNPEFEAKLREYGDEYQLSRQTRMPFTFPVKKCHKCHFQTESQLVLEGHYLIPHLSNKGEYFCHFCDFVSTKEKLVFFHMNKAHDKCDLVDLPATYNCKRCLFSHNVKRAMSRHVNKCRINFRCEANLVPDKFSLPATTPRPIIKRDTGGHKNVFYGKTRSRSRQNSQECLSASKKRKLNVDKLSKSTSLGQQQINCMKETNMQMTPKGSEQCSEDLNDRTVFDNSTNPPSLFPPMEESALPTLLQMTSSDSRSTLKSTESTAKVSKARKSFMKQASKKRRLDPTSSQSSSPSREMPTFVMCEICSGYVKNYEQLKQHMYRMHQQKIYSEASDNQPLLPCQKCGDRFFTEYGMDHHLLITHGLVTSNMAKVTEKNQDMGICPLCKQLYMRNLVQHMEEHHWVKLRPANVHYRCRVCSAMFDSYSGFKSHACPQIRKFLDNDLK